MLTILRLGGLHLITTSDIMGGSLNNKVIKIPGDQKFTIRRFVQEDTGTEIDPFTMLRTATEISDSGREMAYHAETARSKAQTLKLDKRSCRETQNPIYPECISLSHCPTRVHTGLAENQLLLGHIQEAIQGKETHGKGKIMDTHSQVYSSKDDVYAPTEHSSAGALICSRSEPCPDDVSESTECEFYSFDDNCSEHYCPSPAGFLESSSSFYPESYTIDSLFKDPLFVISEKRSDIHLWTKQYFILYAKTPRQWRKLTVSATFEGLSDRVSIFGADISHDSEQQDITLPHVIWDYTIRHLSQVSRFMLVTNLSLFFKQDESGSLSHDQMRSSIREDCMEVRSSGEDQTLRDIEDLGCKQFLESEIITQSRKSSSCFIVRVESRTCIERKAPFVNSGMRGANGFQNFFRDLKFLKSLGGCSGVAQFVGVVLDDTRTQLRSYIYEYPALGTVLSLFLGAQSKREIIPWRIRESWARQLVEAVADIHGGKGSLVGGLCWLDEIGVRANGTIVLTALRASQRYFNRGRGMMAPELRGIPGTNTQTLKKMANFRTETFALGHLLWRIAEHKTNTASCFCSRSACIRRPCYMCAADHADPIELPPCNAEVPLYFNAIIKQCRSQHPKDRKTARQLREMFPKTADHEPFPTYNVDVLKRFARSPTMSVYCDECGSPDMSVHYHCNQCYKSNFDLCVVCFGQGISCWNPQHRLMKRIITDETNFKIKVVSE